MTSTEVTAGETPPRFDTVQGVRQSLADVQYLVPN